MKITRDELPNVLATGRYRTWLVSGDEPLLVGECADAIRKHARGTGCTDREVYFVERNFDWNVLRQSAASLSLFGARRLIEVRLPSGKPGVDGAQVLGELMTEPPPDTVWLMITGHLDRTARSSAWVQAVERRGVWLPLYPLEPAELLPWLAERCERSGLAIDRAALRLLASRVEGNLLAAQQEIDKLALLAVDSHLTVDLVDGAVLDSSRQAIEQLLVAALRGDGARALRQLAGLREAGEEPTLILWNLATQIEALLAPAAQPRWQPRAVLAAANDALHRRARLPGRRLLERVARADRVIKGRAPGDAWDELALLVADLAGREVFCGAMTVDAGRIDG